MRLARRLQALLALLVLGALALAARWLSDLRPAPRGLARFEELVVRRATDAGPGSLREAVLAADRAPTRARISFAVPRVVVTTSLPPLVNPHGVTVDGGAAHAEVDAAAAGDGPVIDVGSPGSLVTDLTVRGATGPAFLVRATDVRLVRVRANGCGTGVVALARAARLVVEDAEFERNGVGVQVTAGALPVRVRGCRFREDATAGVWAVAPAGSTARSASVELVRNRFEGDRMGVVLIHVPTVVEGNEFVGARDLALYLTGGGGEVRGNRVRGGRASGISLVAADHARIEGNEIDHQGGAGIVVCDSRASLLRDNRVYENGYGIVVVFGERSAPDTLEGNLIARSREDGVFLVGASPILRGNHILSSRLAGVRALDFIPWQGGRRPSEPRLVGNTILDVPETLVRGEYRARPLVEEKAGAVAPATSRPAATPAAVRP